MNGAVTFRGDRSDPAPAFGLKMAPVWRVAGRGAAFGLKMAPVWRVAGPGAVFGLKMAPVWRVAGPGAVFGLKIAPYAGSHRGTGVDVPVAYLLRWRQR
jgi:hypothetical protein